jgi:DNA-binding CsgD family transcriptional regulator
MRGIRYQSSLTPREEEILRLIAAGLTTRQIAIGLGIRFKTVCCHRTHIMDKLGLHSLAELVRYAFRHQYLSLDAHAEEVERQLLQQVRLAERACDEAAVRAERAIQAARATQNGAHNGLEKTSGDREVDEKYREALKAFTDRVFRGAGPLPQS